MSAYVIGEIVLPFAGLAAISGIFYPITHLPGWLQAIGQVFPVYWLGLGMRAALLPGALQSVELDRSWRLGHVLLALCGWAARGAGGAAGAAADGAAGVGVEGYGPARARDAAPDVRDGPDVRDLPS